MIMSGQWCRKKRSPKRFGPMMGQRSGNRKVMIHSSVNLIDCSRDAQPDKASTGRVPSGDENMC
jgi:hypothetical protein